MVTKKNFQKLLEENFPISDKSEWKKVAASELDGKDPFASLAWNISDNVTYVPYYDHQDVLSLDYLQKFHARLPQHSFLGNRAWQNVPIIVVTNELTDNQKALQFLNMGADGISFDLATKSAPDLKILLKGIAWQYCSISFSSCSVSLAEAVSKYITDHKLSDSATGNLFWDENRGVPSSAYSFLGRLRSCGLLVEKSTPVDEICSALLWGLRVVDSLSGKFSLAEVISFISFSLPADTQFFLTIAKMKALRVLWYQFVKAYGVEHYSPDDLHIHIRSVKWVEEKYQPHANLLKSTSASLAAIIGGCNSLSIEPEVAKALEERMAINVSNILREESHLSRVADPLAGAYAIEVITDSLAREAWSKFQALVK
jgi:methylmalonyl-CoA mutase